MLEILKNPGVIVFITGLVGACTYLFQDWRKTAVDRRDRKRQLYEELLKNIFELFFINSQEERCELVSKIEKCWLFSSDEVLKECYSFLKQFDSILKESEEIRKSVKTKESFENIIARIFFQMRHDLRGRTTKIKENWAEENVVIYGWRGIISVSENEGKKAKRMKKLIAKVKLNSKNMFSCGYLLCNCLAIIGVQRLLNLGWPAAMVAGKEAGKAEGKGTRLRDGFMRILDNYLDKVMGIFIF